MKGARILPINREAAASILDHMVALADPIRCRMLLALEQHELTVSELCGVLQLPQSTVSRHLKTLADDGWVVSRRDGTSRYYSMALEELDGGARRLWPLIREQIAGTSGADQDQRRLKSVLARRRTKSEEFFSSASGRWDRLRDELFGSTFHLHALLALLDPALTAGDLGCGTGQLTALLAPHVSRVIAVDASTDMLKEARARLKGRASVEFRLGHLESLPIEDQQLDVAVMMLVLHHVPDPARALADCARVLKPGGRALVVDMLPHDRVEYQQQMGHVWLGFPERQTRKMLTLAGFSEVRIDTLPVDPVAKGPALFVAVAKKGT
jgi:ubiquinone/menaquinone biosynthesis C-methylase UbiE